MKNIKLVPFLRETAYYKLWEFIVLSVWIKVAHEETEWFTISRADNLYHTIWLELQSRTAEDEEAEYEEI
jgi:hypothetical protein